MRFRDFGKFVGYVLVVSLIVAIVCIAFANVADAQMAKPRKPTASANAPAPKAGGEKPAEAPKAAEEKKAEASALTIVGELPKQVEGGRRVVTTLHVEGGKPPYDWGFSAETNEDVQKSWAVNHDPKDKEQRNAEIVWWVTKKAGPTNAAITVSDDTAPKNLSVTREFKVNVTPFVAGTQDLYYQGNMTKGYAREMRDSMSSMRWELKNERATAYKYADDKIAEANARVDQQVAGMKNAAQGYVQQIVIEAGRAVLIFVPILFAILIGVGFIAWKVKGFRVVTFVVLSLFAAGSVWSAEPAKVSAKKSEPAIVAVSPDGLTQGAEETLTIAVRGIKPAEVDKVVFGDKIAVSDLKATAKGITVKVAVDAAATPDDYSPTITTKAGKEVKAAENVELHVFAADQGRMIYYMQTRTDRKVRTDLKAVEKRVLAGIEDLKKEKAAYEADQKQKLVELEARIRTEIGRQVAAGIADYDAKAGAPTRQNVAALAEIVHRAGERKVNKIFGLGGSKILTDQDRDLLATIVSNLQPVAAPTAPEGQQQKEDKK